jgi:CubicO group peptidase (beta-lactamase class C family)
MADLERRLENGPETVFRIASTSKQFTGACIAILVRRGVLDLEAPIQAYLPEMRIGTPVPLRTLVFHTSGIPDYLLLHRLRGEGAGFSPQESLDLLAGLSTTGFRPGSRHVYSNSNYLILGQIVRRVTGSSLRAFAQAEIFGPLGMADTRFHDDHRDAIPDLAIGYEEVDGVYDVCMTTQEHVGDGGLHTTVRDMALWDANFYRNRLNQADDGLLALMQTPDASLEDGVRYAFGMHLDTWRGVDTISHEGAFVGYRAEYLRIPDHGLSVVILANDADADVNTLCHRVASVVLADVLPEELKPSDRAYAGRYRSGELEVEYVITYSRESLAVEVEVAVVGAVAGTGSRIPLTYDSPGRYLLMGEHLTFSRDATGGVRGFVVSTECGGVFRFERVG